MSVLRCSVQVWFAYLHEIQMYTTIFFNKQSCIFYIFKVSMYFFSSMGDSSTSVLPSAVSQQWSSAEHTQRWHKHLEVLWDPDGPWVQAGLYGPFDPAFQAAR